MANHYDLRRFVDAQDANHAYDRALRELRAGRKQSHWMWFVFPQIAGLGRSEMAARYAIAGLPEARAYLRHPTLGARLIEATRTVVGVTAPTAEEIFGAVDAMKLRSSMTLFARADPDEPVFRQVLTDFFDGQEDEATVQRLGSA
jgi:uncharacterized protein (DUF1810 family)